MSTTPQSKAKNWCFTLNNYTADEEEAVRTLTDRETDCVYVLYGREVGEEEGTPHLQGFVSFSKRLLFARVQKCLPGNPHLEVARNVAASITYCKKDGDFFEFGSPPGSAGSRSDLESFKIAVKSGVKDLKVIREEHSEVYSKYTRFCLEYVADHYPGKELEDHPLRPWQENLLGILSGEPDDRSIVFVVDEVGNSGKTWFAHWYSQKNENCQVMLPGKKADMAYALDSQIRVLFVDAPRSKQGEYLQYDFLEDVKNGYVFSTKYESRIKTLKRCHLVVSMNEQPDMTKLSMDRYHIINLE